MSNCEIVAETKNALMAAKELRNSCRKLYYERNRELFRTFERENSILNLKTLLARVRRQISNIQNEVKDLSHSGFEERSDRSLLGNFQAIDDCLAAIEQTLQLTQPNSLNTLGTAVVQCEELYQLVKHLRYLQEKDTGTKIRPKRSNLEDTIRGIDDLSTKIDCVIC